MRTRSGLKYQDGQAKVAVQIKSPPKQAKQPKAKAKSEVKEKVIEENVETENKRIRNKANTEIKAKKVVKSPKKSPQKSVQSPIKRSLRNPKESIKISPQKTPEKKVNSPKKTPEKQDIISKKTSQKPDIVPKKTPEKATVEIRKRPKRGEPVESPPKTEPSEAKTSEAKTSESKTSESKTSEAKPSEAKTSEAKTSEAKRPLRKAKAQPVVEKKSTAKTKQPIKAKETLLEEEEKLDEEVETPEETPELPLNEKPEIIENQPTIETNQMDDKIEEPIDSKASDAELETNSIQTKTRNSNALPTKSEKIESQRPVRKTRAQTIVTKKQKTKNIKQIESKESDSQKGEKMVEKDNDEISVKEKKDIVESQPTIVSNEIIDEIDEPIDSKVTETDDTIESEPMDSKEAEATNLDNSNDAKPIDLREAEPMDTKEAEPKVSDILEPTTSQIVVTSSKRKSIEVEVLPKKTEAVKKLKVCRFSVPPIPQICGQLYSFGEEIAGELGPRLKRVDDIKLKSNEPSIVTDEDGLALDNIVFVVCGAMHSSCLSSEGEVITFGCNDDSALGRDTQTGSDETDDSIDVDESEEREAMTPKLVSGLPPVIKVTAGDMHTCALCKDGSVYVWGNLKDESKKLGLFADCLKCDNSDDFNATPLPKLIPLETKIVDIASGCHHILLLTEDGDLLSFGEGSKGQLGRIKDIELQTIVSNRELFLNPQKVDFGVGVVIEKVWANHWSSYAKTTSGGIYVWGLNNYHQLGFKSSGSVRVTNPDPNESQTSLNLIIELKPTKVEKMPNNVSMVANGQHHMLALDADGQVFSCGSNTYGKLGYKTDNADQTMESPQMISAEAFNNEKVKHIECGEFCSFAITESGHLMAWGQGSAHIGSAGFTDIEVPTRVKGSLADSTRFISVSSGSQHSLLIGNKNTINGN